MIVDSHSVASVFLSIKDGLARAIAGIVPPKEIEDIVQETYVRVCQVKSSESIHEPRRFLYRTARNLALDFRKKAETRLTDAAEWEEDFTDEDGLLKDETFDLVATNEEFAQFCEAVRHLPVQCRRVFVLKKVYGLSQREIAKELDIKESTVEKHVALGIKRCTYYMMKYESQGKRAVQDIGDITVRPLRDQGKGLR
ncbi:MAG: RNA polymerase sigma factor [Woeseia sp.]